MSSSGQAQADCPVGCTTEPHPKASSAVTHHRPSAVSTPDVTTARGRGNVLATARPRAARFPSGSGRFRGSPFVLDATIPGRRVR
jgi:hypothetical protein